MDNSSLDLQTGTTIQPNLSHGSLSMNTELLQHQIFINDVILRHLFSVVPLEDLKTYRQVCTNWKNLSEKEFKKRSLLKFDFRRMQSVFNVVNQGAFSQHAESMFATFTTIQNTYPEIPRDSFSFSGHIALEDVYLREFFRSHGTQIKHLCLEIRISSPDDLIMLQNLIIEYLPNIEHLSINWAAETMFMIERLLEHDPEMQSLSLLKELGESTKMPKSLKLLNITMLDGNQEFAYIRTIEGNVLRLFHNLLASTNYLEQLEFSDKFSIDMKILSPSFAANLREIRFKMLRKPCCSNMIDLLKLTARCPRLNSFSIEYTKLSTTFINLNSLFEILYHVKDRLKKLRIYWEPCIDPIYEVPLDEIYGGDKKILEFPKMKSLEVLDISYNLLSHNAMYSGIIDDWLKQFPVLKTLKFRYNVQKCVVVEHPYLICLPNFLYDNDTVHSIIFDCSQTVTLWKDYSRLEIKNLKNYFQITKSKFKNLKILKIIEQEDGIFMYSVHSYSGITNDHCSYLVDFKYYNRYLKCN